MKESTSIMNTNNTATAQAGQVISLAACREQKISEAPFADNLDYLQALELEGLLILANALFRMQGADGQSNFDCVQLIAMMGLSAAEIKPEKLAELIPLIEQKNRHRVEMAEQEGTVIYFTKLCREKKISGFDRKLIMLLLLLATTERFTKIFDLCAFGENARKGSEVKIGTMLNIICCDYREQLASRKYFSLESSLISQDILHIECTVEDKSSILERYVSINDRYVRYLIGDNNFYKSASSMIQRDNGSVRLDQVIIPEETKKELVARVGNYLACRDNKRANMLDDFYGYGTALTLLFYGPSGTGKTMMAHALAHHFSKPLYSLMSRESQPESFNSIDDGVKKIFLEASLNAGIVYFDEADDFFVKDTLLSRLLLIEIEKARCVVILSTNKPVDLDPAMDRRLSLKVCFSIPDAELRYKMWQALMPAFVKLAPDVDFRQLADRYKFTGGLIKNSILMTLVSSMTAGNKEDSTVTMEMIEHAAQLQLHQMIDMKDLYQIYTPVYKRSDLQIGVEQKIQLGNVVNVYRNMQEKKLGLNILITSNDMQTGIDAVEALANECHLKIKKFSYTDVFKRNNVDGKVFDPITQTKKFPIELAFAESTGDASLLMFVDSDRIARWTDQKRFEWNSMERMFMDFDLRDYLKSYQGLFCMVTVPPLQKIPKEFNLHFNLEYPPEETQMRQWEKNLGKNKVSDDELVLLVENNPLHIAEIDYIAKQAVIQSAIKASSGGLTIKDIDNVITRYSPKRSTPLLFGG